MFTEPIYAQYWLAPHLMAEEVVLWTGHPDPRKVIITRDIIAIPFGLGIGIALTIILPDSFAIHLLAAVLWTVAILYILVFRYLLRYLEKKRTQYVMTGQRIMILLQKGDEAIIKESLPYVSMVAVTHNQVSDERGTVAFEPVMPARNKLAKDKYDLGLQNRLFSSDTPAFFDIKDSKEVFDTINQIRFRNYRQILGDWNATPLLPL